MQAKKFFIQLMATLVPNHRIFKCISITFVLLFVSLILGIFFLPIPPLLTGLDYSKAVYDRQQKLLRLTLSQDGKYRLLTPLAAISPYMLQATLIKEDRYFMQHLGVNPISLCRAFVQTYLHGSRRIGASTITMQVARIRYGIHSKTWSGKAWQIIRALQLEMHYSKAQILEAYLNLAPYGNNIEGVEAASLIYFGKPAHDITLHQALTLAVIPQSPSKRILNKEQLKVIRNRLLQQLLKQFPNEHKQLSIMNLPLQMNSIQKLPFLAPHFVNHVLAHSSETTHRLFTTLDLNLQNLIEKITKNYLLHKKIYGVENAAILLVDTKDMSVRALLGSADFFNQKISGQVNGSTVKRSPGSTLKPFIYGLALDQGLIHPASMLKDVPHHFGSYNPENFDYDFVGPIKAKDALVLSRNIPAIYLAEQLKQPNLYEFLQRAGVEKLQAESYYGLALALGGAELTMQELAGLYAMLANDGLWQPLHFLQSNKKISVTDNNPSFTDNNPSLLSKEASYLVLDMLQDPTNQKSRMAWKTGTSSGYRDAWTAGVVGPYVLVVWLGNFNNQANQAFIGKDLAAPLFLAIANALQMYEPAAMLMTKNLQHFNLRKIAVCQASGMLPTRYCPDTEKVWFIPGKSPIKTDTIYREIAIDERSGLRACRFDQHTRFAVYEFWPSDLLKIFKQAGIQRRIPPTYQAGCNQLLNTQAGMAPQIVSPQGQIHYIARLHSKSRTQIPLQAVVDADVKNIYWFVNDSFLAKTFRDKAYLWTTQPGNYVIRAVDDYGRADARDITVRLER